MGGRALGLVAICSAMLAVVAASAWATPPASCAPGPAECVAGGGSKRTDCALEWALPTAPELKRGLPVRKLICHEGDPHCDADPDLADHRCLIPIALCINVSDPRLQCVPSDVATFTADRPAAGRTRDAADEANLEALELMVRTGFGVTVLHDKLIAYPGATNDTPDLCTAPAEIAVPMRVRRNGTARKGRKTLRITATTSAGERDRDTLKLECRPSTCGNGSVEPHEDCDDGNRTAGDGCGPGCRNEPPTPTPTATPVPSSTVTQTGTRTATPTQTPSSTSTGTNTPTTTGTPTNTATATATRTGTATATGTATFTATPTVTDTATSTPTWTPTPTFTLPPVSLTVTAYRPQTEFYGGPFQRRAVPSGELVSPGIGARINGDDDNGNGVADYLDTVVVNENDLIEVVFQINPILPPPGYEYVLRRSNGGLKVWDDPLKGFALLDANDEVALIFNSPTRTVWLERFAAGSTMLELVARPFGGGTPAATGQVTVSAFTSIVIALGGENQSPSDPPNPSYGMFNIAASLYALGYDVHMYDEDNVSGTGAGIVYDEVVRAIRDRGVTQVAIYGYSHGGGGTFELAKRLHDNRASIGTFTFPFTGYVDAINNVDINPFAETRLPPTTAYHVNYYQTNEFLIQGDDVPGADLNLNVNSTPWGADLEHSGIDDHPNVRAGIFDPLVARVAR